MSSREASEEKISELGPERPGGASQAKERGQSMPGRGHSRHRGSKAAKAPSLQRMCLLKVRAKAATSGDPQQRAQGGRGRLCLLCRRGSPPQPLPPAPRRALHSPGFPSGPARLGSCQGTELTFASREFQLAADQISGRARLSGHCGGSAPPPPRRAKRAPDGNKDEDAAPPASPGKGRGGPAGRSFPPGEGVTRPALPCPSGIPGAWVWPR